MKNLDFIRNIKVWPYGHEGDFKIAKKLAEILDELNDDKISYKVCRHIMVFRNKTFALSRTKVYFECLYELLYNDTVRIIRVYKYPQAVETHLLNLIHAIYSSRLKEFRWSLSLFNKSKKK
jgi:hypothetical protein